MASWSAYSVSVAGVTLEGRQRVVASMVPGEELLLRREPDNIHDPDAISVVRLNGQQVGYIGRYLARRLASALDSLGGTIPAKVVGITGGGPGYSYGVDITFRIPQEKLGVGTDTALGPEMPSDLQPPPWTSDYEDSSVWRGDVDDVEDVPWYFQMDPRYAKGATRPHKRPYTLAPGQTAQTLPELVQLCSRNRVAAAGHLVDGAIGRWLEETASWIYEYDPSGTAGACRADEYEVAAISAEIVVEQFRRTEKPSSLELQFVLEEWLRTLSYYHPEPNLMVQPQEIRLPPMQAGEQADVKFEVANANTGILTGSIDTSTPWLQIPEREFVCFAGTPSQHIVRVTAPASGPGQGSILITSNGGTRTIELGVPRARRAVEIVPTTLNFGQVPPEPREMQLTLKNTGNVMVDVRVTASHARIVRCVPDSFSLDPEEPATDRPLYPAQFAKELRISVNWARAAGHNLEGQLAVHVDYGEGPKRIPIQAAVIEPKMSVSPTEFSIGRTSEENFQFAFTVSNSGTAPLNFQVLPRHRSLEVESSGQRECAPGSKITCSSVLHLNDLPQGPFKLPQAIVVRSPIGSQAISICGEHLPEITVSPSPLVLEADDRGRASGELMVTNNLAAPQEIALDSSRAYVRAEPKKLVCEPGETRRFAVHLSFMPGPHLIDPQALSIKTKGSEEIVGIEATRKGKA